MDAPSGDAASKCPVDHKAREAWLKVAQEKQAAAASKATPSAAPVISSTARPKFSTARPLSTDREVSTIPRGGLTITSTADTAPSTPAPSPLAHGVAAAVSPNAQTTGDPHTSASGHWIYPSEEMFFNAMKRKSYSPEAKDMASIIPIHNAVNERTWADILAWERRADPASFERCGGPKLVSFQGDATKLSPRARWNGLMGYQTPFDRHDWVVERCGTRVEYIIDFYQGKAKGPGGAMPLSFYLDVRPKLNSWEGCRMRIARFWGMG